MSRRKNTPVKRETITFEPDDDVREMLNVAKDALSQTRTKLINDALRSSLPAVINSYVSTQTEALSQLRKRFMPALLSHMQDKRPKREE